ncbi:MAG: methylmalonyl Co-A mutase-associated GTPase MeaB [Candidatus Accumulibacter sp.]|jgi:LAO/AO transport system kinase|nr:methylmalonyl Co-A mutase-associated GTPase MeaB [Accumulibacter sp.]
MNEEESMRGHDAHHRPEWVPERAGEAEGFTTNVMPGIKSRHDGMPGATKETRFYPPGGQRRELEVDEYVDGVLSGDRAVLARAITLVESNAERHQDKAQEMLSRLIPHVGKTVRIGFTGVPGSGKSSLIETLGLRLCERGHRLAVLAVDPSSSVTGGSILGDKTRMEQLSRNRSAYIRPSPSGGVLGGVARKSRETMIVCEAAGFDVIFVETVGVGQSEITVRSMVDLFLLLQIAGAGDELQGIKKGVMERCDLVVVNKADGDNKTRARAARADYERILRYLQPSTEGWKTRALACSAYTGEGVDELWDVVEAFRANTLASGVFEKRRQQQNLDWMHNLVVEQIKRAFYGNANIKLNMQAIEQRVIDGKISPTQAATHLLRLGSEGGFRG